MNNNPLKELNGKVSPLKALPFSLQQILAMFITNVVPIGIVAAAASQTVPAEDVLMLMQNAMIAAGIATFIQVTPIWRVGSGLPVFMGISFAFLVPLTAVVTRYGYATMVGTVIAGGLFEGLLGLTARYWKKIIAPIVSAVVVTAIGLSLVSTAARSFGGGYVDDFGSVPYLVVGLVTVVVCLMWQFLMKGVKRHLGILAGLAAGYIAALLYGMVDLSQMTGENWFALPRLLPYKPVFNFEMIFPVCLIFLVSAVETMGDASALVRGTMKREISLEEISGALAADGFGSTISGLLGVTPITSYSENIGLTIMTGVINRKVARIGTLIMILFGLFPHVGMFVRTIPTPAIGGVLVIVIGQILVSGFQMISEAGFTQRNKMIVSLSLAIGIGFTTSTEAGIWVSFPVAVQTIFGQSIVAVVFVIAMLLHLLLPKNVEENETE